MQVLYTCSYPTCVYLHLLFQYSDDEGDSQQVKRGRRRRLQKRKTKASIYDIYEPDELEMSHFTDQDKDVRLTDIPERFQVCTCTVQLIGRFTFVRKWHAGCLQAPCMHL